MTLLDQVTRSTARDKAEAGAKYRELLGRMKEPHDGDANELREVMEVIGIDLARVKADAAALDQLAVIDQSIVPDAKMAELENKAREAVETLEREDREYRERREAMCTASHEANTASLLASRKNKELREARDVLLRSHPLVWPDVKAAPAGRDTTPRDPQTIYHDSEKQRKERQAATVELVKHYRGQH